MSVYVPARTWLHRAWERVSAQEIRVRMRHGETLEDIADAWCEEAIEGPVGVEVEQGDMLQLIKHLLEEHPNNKGQ